MPIAKVPAKKNPPAKRKASATKVIRGEVYADGKTWTVQHGELKGKPVKGRPAKTPDPEHLFRVVGEKLPFSAISKVKAHLKAHLKDSAPTAPKEPQGVYIAHDSMGCPRYIGRGSIFARLEARYKAQPIELEYFSFYVVSEKKHEREVETLMIRAAGFLLEFNTRKKRVGIAPGDVHDYEAGTIFYERQRKKGTAKKVSVT